LDEKGWVVVIDFLNVQGKVRFSKALMPNGNPETQGQVLVSQGLNQAPV
jgi:hypothetical protein